MLPILFSTSCTVASFPELRAARWRFAHSRIYRLSNFLRTGSLHPVAIEAAAEATKRSELSMISGLPCVTIRSAPAITFSGPAQRLLTLWPARSPSRLATLYIESSDSFVASAAVSIATGWSEPVPGRELHPLKPSAFSRRTCNGDVNDSCPQVCLSFRVTMPPLWLVHIRRGE